MRRISSLCRGMELYIPIWWLPHVTLWGCEDSDNQCGILIGCGTSDAMQATRLVLEKHQHAEVGAPSVLLDWEVFDRALRDDVSSALRQRARRTLNSYRCSTLVWKVRSGCGRSINGFSISVGMRQGFALSSFIFVDVMHAITRNLQKPVPWTLLHAVDVMLALPNKASGSWMFGATAWDAQT